MPIDTDSYTGEADMSKKKFSESGASEIVSGVMARTSKVGSNSFVALK